MKFSIKKDSDIGYIYIEMSDGGVVNHKKNLHREELEIEYQRLLREILRAERPFIELEKGHAIFIKHIVEIWIRDGPIP